MPKKPLTIIGINPGSRYLGVAVFQNLELKDWGIKVIREKNLGRRTGKVKQIMESFTWQYNPDVLAIKKLHPSRTSSNLNQLVRRIKKLARGKNMEVCQYSIEDMEEFFLPEKRKNKKKLAETVAFRYPSLFPELEKEKANKNPYYIRVFEAVTLGSVLSYKLDKGR